MGHDGMLYSLPSREVIADSVEYMVNAHKADAMVCISNCDKITPGMLMAAMRLNIPTVFVSGGPMEAGVLGDRKLDLIDAMVQSADTSLSDAEVAKIEAASCPGCGCCSGMFTANSMNCLTEVLGLGLKGNGTIPAVYSARIELAKHAGMQVMECVRKNIRPSDILTEEAFENALAADMAIGCSTNSMLHIPAIANECGIKIDLDHVNEISERTPNICHLAPAGPTYMEDLQEAGGIHAVLKELLDAGLINGDVMTVTGKTLRENVADSVVYDPEVIRPIDAPFSKTGGLAVLQGNLAPDG
jgi:dihydroxy-acid dehydratase